MGKIGIGTTTPGTKLDVYNSIGNQVQFNAGYTDFFRDNQRLRLDSAYSGAAGQGSLISSDNGLALGGYLGNRDMFISTLGKVGIGTTSPARLLHLYSSTGESAIQIDSTAAQQTGLYFEKDNLPKFAIYNPPTSNDLRFYNYTASADTFTINGNGGVGIGTTSPTGTLDIVKSATSAIGPILNIDNPSGGSGWGSVINFNQANRTQGYLKFNYRDTTTWTMGFSTGAGTDQMTLTGTGQLGIGTTTPSTQLQVTASASNATSTLTVGKLGQNKGSCLEMYDVTGAVQYVRIISGAFVISSVSCK
jgi:trimeric autotransporter adhesin